MMTLIAYLFSGYKDFWREYRAGMKASKFDDYGTSGW